MAILSRLLDPNEREVKRHLSVAEAINGLEPELQALYDAALRARSDDLRERARGGEDPDELLIEAFALCREASRRTIGLRHFDVQLVGGIVLHQGKIAEMKTGEGKTLVASLALYLNALAGKGVHLVTVNDYLARRDAGWMGPIYHALGLTVGVNVGTAGTFVYDPEYVDETHPDPRLQHFRPASKKEAYAADITYATNSELAFDYLRDNMARDLTQCTQRALNYAIVDEVDSILIDEARTPHIISGQSDESTEKYYQYARWAARLSEGEDFEVDLKHKSASLTEIGIAKMERWTGIKNIYDLENVIEAHQINQALKAKTLFLRDRDYLVKDGEVVIVDEFTGRTLPGRRWSDGLHQAVEAKEGVPIQRENQTLASITFQNYFRMYGKLAGMTGTADTEAYEFQEIYGLETVVIPPNMPTIRKDELDLVYKTSREKFEAVIQDIRSCHERGQPVLVGTTSIENSELISGMLQKEKLPHQVLNAKQHAREAEIVAQAGRPKMITIATNMAGRGTDIVLGGAIEPQILKLREDEALTQTEKDLQIGKLRSEWQDLHNRVIAAGGLHIIGTERHEARRIDNQLRGRSGRQGDPGSSRFYLSLEDPLLRIFAGERVNAIMQRLGMPEGEPIEHGLVTRSIESAQRKVEAHNFDIRKQLLEYDNVANDQRREIYQLRNSILESQDVSDQIAALREGVVTDIFRAYIPEESMEEQWDIPGLEKVYAAELRLDLPLSKWLESDPGLDDDALLKRAVDEAHAAYVSKMAANPPEAVHQFERLILLSTLDNHWLEHLAALDHLRQGIHLRGYAQKNPKQEYKREAFELFGNLVESVKLEVTRTLMTVELRNREQVEQVERVAPAIENVQYQHAGYEEALAGAGPDAAPASKPAPFVRQMGKIGRNDPCPCGSGKKYKHCHGKLA